MERFVTQAEAAALTGLSESTIRRRVDSGELAAFRFGERAVRIPVKSLRAYIEKCRSDSGDVQSTGSNSDTVKHG